MTNMHYVAIIITKFPNHSAVFLDDFSETQTYSAQVNKLKELIGKYPQLHFYPIDFSSH